MSILLLLLLTIGGLMLGVIFGLTVMVIIIFIKEWLKI